MSVTRLTPGEALHGFTLRRVDSISSLNLTLYDLTHNVTGARWLHLACSDDNNLFAVGFRTPPTDSTGVAHILEHTVLCGSQRFPVRDPFFSMLKRSLSTFMNALTASDWTLYPFSSQNRKDFYNLLDIYLDATFFPLLTERDFSQEGHRLEFDGEGDDAPLVYKGVVYNEMKGAMADPSSLLHRRLGKHLYPTTTYHHNSGGEPTDIPQLTWEQLREFHAAYYHPSNCYIFTYGNLPLEDHLAVVQERALGRFERRAVDSAVPPEQRYDAPRRVEETYPLDPGQSTAGKTFVQMAWCGCDINDSFERLALTVLSTLLMGNPGAPLYRALIESKLGANLTPLCGYDDDNRTTSFGVGLQGTDPDKAGAIEALVLDTLRLLTEDGFTRERIEGVLHRLEFSHREVSGDSYPYPLVLLMRLLGTWIHGGDPRDVLNFDRDLERIRAACFDGPFFQDLIRRQLLDNPHRVTLVLRPDTGQQAQEDAALAAELAARRQALSADEARALREQAAALQAAQDTPDDLSVLPTLELSDIPPEERPVHGTATTVGRLELHWFDQPTNGIGYVNLYLPVDELPAELVPLVPLFCSLVTQVGAAGYDYAQLAELMEAHTGGIRFRPVVMEAPDRLDGVRGFVTLRAKCLVSKQQQMHDLLDDIFHTPNFKDTHRIHTVLQQIESAFENGIPGSGHSYAGRAAGAVLTPGGRLRELWNGLEQLQVIKGLLQGQQMTLEQLADGLLQIKKVLFCHEKAHVAVTAEGADFPQMRSGLLRFLNYLPDCPLGPPPGMPEPSALGTRQGYIASVPVSYVAQTFRTVPHTHPDSPALMVLAKLLRAEFLHREIREKGGAYGGMASYNAEGGLMSLLSYRDPHILRTLDVYRQAADWAAQGDFGKDSIKEAILGVFSDLDKPLSPAGRAGQEYYYRLQGLDRDQRNRYRQSVLTVDADRLADVARRYLVDGQATSAVAVLSGEEALTRANRDLGRDALALTRLSQ